VIRKHWTALSPERRKAKRDAATGSSDPARWDGESLSLSDSHQASSSDDQPFERSNNSSNSSNQYVKPVRSLKARALGYLSRREYSRAELSGKLAPFAEEAGVLQALLDSLECEGWLSDLRFAESLMHRRAARMGTSRIISELRRHAVCDTLIDEASTRLRETELIRAQAVWSKKYGQLPETPLERVRQARFLAMRGFSRATIIEVLKGCEKDWDDA
jgi:regulatory protein